MACSGVWLEHLENGSIKIGVTDYHVSEFGDSDWEWSALLDHENIIKLEALLKSELGNELTLKEMIIKKFDYNLNTVDFVKYLDKHGIQYIIDRFC